VAFQKVLDFLSGRPTADFDPDNRPGHDTFRLSDVTEASVYTSWLYFEKNQGRGRAVGDASDPRHFKLVAMAIKPYEQQDGVARMGLRTEP
jgi:hypothetical protein